MDKDRQCVSSGSPFEGLIGFSRAVRAGNYIAISGTAPIGPDGNTIGLGDAYQQGSRCLEIIQQALYQLGAGMDDVIRTRVFFVNMEDLENITRSHSEIFGETMPASSFVRVSGFIDSDWLVEIEADAILNVE
jgi:enamine deaminase RidA (YjgF/YER057c/UK114 family)